MRKRKAFGVIAILLAAFVLLGSAAGRDICPIASDVSKNLSREEDKSQLPQNVWTDVESEAYWEKLFAEIKRSGERRDDLANVAFSQLGYRESKLNVGQDWVGDLRGYTRYGAWYGNPYGDWCAMFVAFCVHYAGIPDEEYPNDANCEYWAQKLMTRGLFLRPRHHEPRRGDLIFFGESGVSRHVGIVWEVSYEKGTITYIHGNSVDLDVCLDSIAIRNGSITGYGVLPEPETVYPMTLGRRIERIVRNGRIE